MKKGQGMSLSVMVIAALVVLVLVVLSILFIRSSGEFSQNTQSCVVQGGKCAFECGDIAAGTQDYTVPRPGLKCSGENQVCCLKIK